MGLYCFHKNLSLEKNSELLLTLYWSETSANGTRITLTDGMQCLLPTQHKMEKYNKETTDIRVFINGTWNLVHHMLDIKRNIHLKKLEQRIDWIYLLFFVDLVYRF